MRVILKMTEKLFEVQRQITEYAVKEGKKAPKEEKVQSDLLTSRMFAVCLKFPLPLYTG